VGSYFAIAHYALRQGVFHDLSLPHESAIPFMPWTVWIYATVYIVPGIAFLMLRSWPELKVMMRLFAVNLFVVEIIWFFFPVQYTLRPNLPAPPAGFLMETIRWFYVLDFPPINCFPSLHVSYAFLTYYVFKAFRPKWAPVFLILAWLIAISTITFKQHFIWDVVMAMFISYILSHLLLKKIPTYD
jgi:membrane-associated phospholipid phosphatase